jgi:hypothetical protein
MDILPIEELNSARLLDPKKAPEQIPVVSIGGAPFAMTGDFSIIGGQPKSGKSSLAIFILATTLDQNPTYDTLTIKSIPAPEDKKVIYIDTEQSQATTYKLLNSVCSLLNTKTSPDQLLVYNLREKRPKERLQFIQSVFHHYPNPHLIIIDGIADLVTDTNKVDESTEVICWLMSMSKEHNTAIIGYLHENPGMSQKLRGNMGSEAERKAYASLSLSKDKDGIHSCSPRYFRSGDSEKVYFKYNKDLSRMVSLSANEALTKSHNDSKSEEDMKKANLLKLANEALKRGAAKLTYDEFWREIVLASEKFSARGIKERTAKKRIAEMREAGIVSLNSDGLHEYIFTKQQEDVFAS